MTKQIKLTISDELYAVIENKRKEHGYFTTQELICDLVRKSLLGSPRMTQNQGGRPKKFEFEDYFSEPPGGALLKKK